MTTIYADAVFNNIDMLTEILLRLPTKPLVKFKSVSKQWLSLISNPQFCLSYNRHHHTSTALLLMNRSFIFSPTLETVPLNQDSIPPLVPFFDYLTEIRISNFRILQSCNGLFLYRQSSTYYICNPTTKQFKILSFPSNKLASVCITFDPLISNYYKVICVHVVKNEEKSYRVDMYSSDTDSWRPLKITTPEHSIFKSGAVFCNGRVHWLAKDRVLYLDVDRECFNTLPMPNLDEHRVRYFGESGGHLHLIMTEKYSSYLQFDVLEMALDYSGWVVRYHVDLDAVRIAFPNKIWNHGFSLLHVHRTHREEESIIVVSLDKEVISYNVHNGTSKKLCDKMRYDHIFYDWGDTFQYFEILTSV